MEKLAEARRRPGGRTARIRQSVLDAAFAQLGETGYAGFSLEAVARRSGVHKTTLYRHRPTRELLVADALDSRTDRDMPPIDTGSVAGDLRSFAEFVQSKLTSPQGSAMVKALVVGVDVSPDVLAT